MLPLGGGCNLWSQAAVVMAAVGALFFLGLFFLLIALLLARVKHLSAAQRRALETVEFLYRTAFYLTFSLLFTQVVQALAGLSQSP